MSDTTNREYLERLSVKRLVEHQFKCDSPQHQDYLIKLETDPRTRSHRFAVYFAVLRAHSLFLFHHDQSEQCSKRICLGSNRMGEFKPVGRWPAGCTEGCQLQLATVKQVPGVKSAADCHQLGFFPSSEWPRRLEAYKTMTSSISGPEELGELWTSLAADAAPSIGALLPRKPPKPGKLAQNPFARSEALGRLEPQQQQQQQPAPPQQQPQSQQQQQQQQPQDPKRPIVTKSPTTSKILSAPPQPVPTTPTTPSLPLTTSRPSRSPPVSLSMSLTSQSLSMDGDAPPPLPPKPISLSMTSFNWNTVPKDLYDMLMIGRPADPVCEYLCRGYYCQLDIRQARNMMKEAKDDGVYMLRGFCSKQVGQERELCVKFDSGVYKFRIRQHPKGYQVWNECNDKQHFSMEALLFYHHIFPICVAKPTQSDFLLRRPFDLEANPNGRTHMTSLLSTALWLHGTKEQCAEILKASPEEGTYALRTDSEGQASAVLCVTHRCQILKLRINVTGGSDPDRREFSFQNYINNQLKFDSLEKLIVFHHNNPICGSPTAQEENIILRVPFQLVPRCQQELAARYRPIDSVMVPAAASESPAAIAEAEVRVCRMRGGNFQLLMRRKDQQQKQQQQQGDPVAVELALLVVRDDNGSVQTFRVMERDIGLSFGPQKLYSIDEKNLVTDKLEKLIGLLCISARQLHPDIMCLLML